MGAIFRDLGALPPVDVGRRSERRLDDSLLAPGGQWLRMAAALFIAIANFKILSHFS